MVADAQDLRWILIHAHSIAIMKLAENNKWQRECGETKPPYIAGGDAKDSSYFGKQLHSFVKCST